MRAWERWDGVILVAPRWNKGRREGGEERKETVMEEKEEEWGVRTKREVGTVGGEVKGWEGVKEGRRE
eukprot:evm.model.NODE_29556_length_6347_cov_38.688042.1